MLFNDNHHPTIHIRFQAWYLLMLRFDISFLNTVYIEVFVKQLMSLRFPTILYVSVIMVATLIMYVQVMHNDVCSIVTYKPTMAVSLKYTTITISGGGLGLLFN